MNKAVSLDGKNRTCSVFDIPNLKEFLKSLGLRDSSELMLRIVDYSTNPKDPAGHVILENLDLYKKKNDTLSYVGTIPTERIGVCIYLSKDVPFIGALQISVPGAVTMYSNANLNFLI